LAAPTSPQKLAGEFKTNRLGLFLIVLMVVAIPLVYSNNLEGPFTFDDYVTVVHNAHIKHLLPLTDSLSLQRQDSPIAGRPVVSFSFALNYGVGGLNVRGYHAVNIALHTLCTLLLFGIVRLTLVSSRFEAEFSGNTATTLAFVCAVMWAVHPLQTETVDYISARTESTMAVFYLLTVYAGIRAVHSIRSKVWLVLAVASCAVAMASKEVASTIPVVVVLYDRTFIFGSFRDALKHRGKFYLGLATTWFGLALLLSYGARFDAAGFYSGVTPWDYLLNQSVMLVRYLELTFWPRSLVFDYGTARPLTLTAVLPYVTLVGALVLATVVALIWQPVLGFLGAWFFIILAPTSSFVPIATEVGAERRVYLSLAAAIVFIVINAYRLTRFALVWGADRMKPTPTKGRARAIGLTLVQVVVPTVVCAALAARTVQRNAEYDPPVKLWQTSLVRWPGPRAERNVGFELIQIGRHDEALPHLRAAAREQPEVRFTLGYELFEQGNMSEAAVELQRFLHERPDDDNVVQARGFLANALASQGKLPEAADQLRQILRAKPNDLAAELGLASTLEALGKPDEAETAFARAVALDPGNGPAQRNFAAFLLHERQLDAAASHAEQAVRLTPGDPGAHTLLGLIFTGQQKFDEAITEFQISLSLEPVDNPARQYLDRLAALRKGS
jgi:protein O-mannosyl-transferase